MKVADGMVFRHRGRRLEIRKGKYCLDGRQLSLTTRSRPPATLNDYTTVEGVEFTGWKLVDKGWKTFYKSI